MKIFKKLSYRTAHYLLTIFCCKEARTFKRSLSRVKETQEKLLFRMLEENAGTKFGRKHKFSSIKNISGFKAQVPVSSYEDYEHYIHSIGRGENDILTKEKVLLFEPSSGSVSATKYIPYTLTLKKQFQRALLPWLYDIAIKNKEVTKGSSYWSISPSVNLCVQPRYGLIPVGFEQDAEYFGPLLKHILKVLLIVPYEVSLIEDIDTFRYVTLLFLLGEKELTFISIWNPTFLTVILESLLHFFPSLISDIEQGTLNPSLKLSGGLAQRLLEKLPKDKKRAEELKAIFSAYRESLIGKAGLFKRIWPNLCFISCWGDGNARSHLSSLRQMFPDAVLQPKGLLATEGVVSFPLADENENILAITSHFFEFIETADIRVGGQPGCTLLAHQLQLGKNYSVIITTGGGLYRYRLNDIIKVVGFKQGCPLVRFIGKEDKVSDLCGEKLNERHIAEILNGAFEQCRLRPRFFMVAPSVSTDGKYFYTLFLQIAGCPYEILGQLSALVEKQLKQNYHYRYCRELGQLQELRIFIISPESEPAQEYLCHCQDQGQKLGGIKPLILDSRLDWASVLQGDFIENKSFCAGKMCDRIK